MEGYHVLPLEDCVDYADIFITTTGNKVRHLAGRSEVRSKDDVFITTTGNKVGGPGWGARAR